MRHEPGHAAVAVQKRVNPDEPMNALQLRRGLRLCCLMPIDMPGRTCAGALFRAILCHNRAERPRWSRTRFNKLTGGSHGGQGTGCDAGPEYGHLKILIAQIAYVVEFLSKERKDVLSEGVCTASEASRRTCLPMQSTFWQTECPAGLTLGSRALTTIPRFFLWNVLAKFSMNESRQF